MIEQCFPPGKETVRISESVSNRSMVMNVSRPSLYRELKKHEDEGLISYAPLLIMILDRDALMDVLSRQVVKRISELSLSRVGRGRCSSCRKRRCRSFCKPVQ